MEKKMDKKGTLKFDKKRSLEETMQCIKDLQRKMVVAEVCVDKTPCYIVGKITNAWVYNKICFIEINKKQYSVYSDAFCDQVKQIKTLDSFAENSVQVKKLQKYFFGIFGGKIGKKENTLYVYEACEGIEAAYIIYKNTKITNIVFDYVGAEPVDVLFLL